MTTENNAAQPGLTDDEINDLCGWRASNTTMRAENDRALARAVESALLSKLRAEGVQAGEPFDAEVLAERLRDLAASHYETAMGFGISRDNFERCATDAAKIAQDMASAPVAAMTDAAILRRWDTHVGDPDAERPLTDADKIAFARAVLMEAGAPVAGEAIYQIKLPGDTESGWHDATEGAYWTATEKARRIVYAAPQASEAVRNAALEEAASICDAEGHEWDSDDQISEKNYAQSAAFRIRALKTQADKDGGDCAKGAGDDAGITASGDERAALEMLIREAQAVADDYHNPRYARLDEAIQSARAALSPTPSVVKQSLTATQTGEKGESDGDQ